MHYGYKRAREYPLSGVGYNGPVIPVSLMTQTHKALAWVLLAALACLIAYMSFRGYLTPELLIDFSNAVSC